MNTFVNAFDIFAKHMTAVAAACGAWLAVSPSVVHADGGIPASGVVTGVWTVADASPTVVDGTLTFAEGASVSLANASLFANAGSRGIPIAVASGGIVGEPAMTNYNFELKLSGRIDLRGGSLDVTNLMGSPDVTNAAPFGVAGLWTVEDDTPMTVTGTLAFRSGARVKIADESLFASVGREGRAIATATGGIVGIPEIESYDYALKLSADGKSLIVYDNIPDVADWTVFTHKATVTFGGVQQGVVLTNFPVLVKLSTAIPDFSYSDFRRPDGAELRFTDVDGNYIPHEIEAWDTNGVSTVWVKVPRLSKDATVTAWYGYANPVRAMDPAGVWDENYLAVWHMNAAEGSLKQRDSTANGKTVSCPSSYSDGVMSGVTGKVGRAARCGLSEDKRGGFSISDNDGYFDGFGEFTVEAWTFRDSVTGALSEDGTIVRKGRYTSSWTNAWCIQENKSGKIQYYLYKEGNGVVWPGSLNAPGFDAWHYHACRWSGTTGKYYLTEDASTTSGGSAPSSPERMIRVSVDGTLTIGNRSTNNNGTAPFCGDIDEVRISNVSRSAAWVKATYDTITDSNFATYTVEEIGPQYVFAHEVDISFPRYSGTALANFPVLVRLSARIPSFSYSDFTLANGGDLRFFDSAGRLLSHEIDTWDPNGVSTVWVKVPMLDATTSITAKYGCTGTPPSVDPKDVWDDGYLGVWHLGAASGESVQPDSTRNQKSFAVNTNNSDGVASGADGVVGRSAATGLRSDGKGCFSYLDGDKFFAGRSAFTVEAWTRQDDSEAAQNPTSRYVLAHSGQTETSYDWRLYETSDGRMAFQMYNVGGSAEITSDDGDARPDRNAWNHTAFAWDGSSGQLGLYLGGAPLNLESSVLTNNWTGVMADGKSGFNLGNHRYDNTKSFKGQIDEVRISKIARSAAWIKATHDTIANANFATYAVDGVEQPPEYVFAKEVDVSFAGYSGGSSLANFPVLVRLSENIPGFSYADFQIANGGDLRFFDAAGWLLSHEIDTWNPNGVSTVWVKVPTLNASTAITAKYGCANPPDNDPKAVWSNGYVGVWHLGEGMLPLRESSEKSNGFSSMSGSTIAFAAPGVVGGSVDFRGGVDNSVVAADHDALDGFSKFTIELWTYQTEWRKNAGVLNKMVSDTSELAYSLLETLTDKGTWTMPIKVGTSRTSGTNWSYHQPPESNRWSHTAFTVDMTITNNNIHGFKNGNMNSWVEKRNYQRTMPNCESDLCLGNSVKGASNAFPGKIDEVRISKVVRSADWIKATYDTIANANFATYSTTAGTLTGYAAWANAKELAGGFEAADAKGIANGVRYAFDIDPEKGPDKIGVPIIQVVRDANGNPCVQARGLASGRSDVTFGILATQDLSDWSNAVLIPMKKFDSDSFWKPSASANSGYVYPDKMFFKYTVEVK